MKHLIKNISVVFIALVGMLVLPSTGLGQGQQILLNIGDSTYPTTASPNNFIYNAAQRGYSSTGINLSDITSVYAPAYLATVAAGTHSFSGGQTITLSASAGAYAKNTVPGDEPDGLMDLYLYYGSTSANTVKIGNLNLQTNATYMLYVYGWIPSSGTTEDSLFTPLNDNTNITFASTASTNGLLAVQFTTSSSYNNTNTLDFTWANRSGQGDGVLNGLAIVQTGGFTGSTAWNGSSSTAWNTAANWTNGVPNGNLAVINVNSPNVATITTNIAIAGGITLGAASGATGQVNQVSGNATNSASLTVGAGGGTGVYNLANTATSGGTLTGYGQGSGNYIGQSGVVVVGTDSGSVGTFNMNSTGVLTVTGNLDLGANLGNGAGTGTFNLDGGTVSVSDVFIGDFGAGTFNMSGGTVNVTSSGPSYVGYLTGSGALNISGGAVSIVHELRVGGSDVSGTSPNATGSVTLSGGNLYVSALSLAYGYDNQNSVSGTVTVNSGSTLISTNDVHLAWAGTGKGTLIINGGTFILGPTATKWFYVGGSDTTASELDITNGNLILDNNSSLKLNPLGSIYPTVVNQEGGAVTFYSDTNVTIGGTGNLDLNTGGNSSSVATYNLDGGTLTVPQVIATVTSGTTYFYFNGGTIKPTANTATFMQGLSAAYVSPGGAHFDTSGKSITVAQLLQDNGGGLTKVGNGTLTLSGGYGYSGATIVAAGTLSVNAANSSSASALTVSNATLSVSLNNGNSSLNSGNVTFAGNSTLNLNFGSESSYLGNPAINASGYTVSISGTNVINITGSYLVVGQYPLIYTGGSVPTNNFTLGTLPSGVVATLVNSGASLDLLITMAGQNLTWYGADNSGNPLTAWDINNSINWNSGSAKYLQYATNSYGDRVTFDDTLYSPSGANITLNTTVVPQNIIFNNSLTPYSITGSGGINGAVSVTMDGTNTVFLGTSNGFTGGITINAGILVVTNDNALGTNSGMVTLGGGTLQFSNSTASVRGFSVVSNSTIDVTASAAVQFSGLVSGVGGLTKTGNGTLTLSNYTAGLLAVKAGTGIVVGSVSSTGNIQVGDDGASGAINLTNGAINATGEFWVGVAGGATGTVNQFGGTVANTGYFLIGRNGSGTVGTYNLLGGTLNAATNGGLVSVGDQVGATGFLNVSGGTLNSTTGDGQFGMSVGTFWDGADGTSPVTGTLTVSGSGLVNLGTLGLSLGRFNANASGMVNLNGGTLQVGSVSRGAGTGTFNFKGGTLKAAASSATFMQGLTAANVLTNGAIIDTSSNSITIAQALIDGDGLGGGLVKTGNGTLILNGANTYTGPTVVNVGTLAGTGTISGSLTNNATLAPGNGVAGTLTINGNITLNPGSTNTFAVNGTTPANVMVAAGANVTYGGVLNIVASGSFYNGQTFTLFSGAGAVTPGNFASVVGSPGSGLGFTFTNGVLSVVSVVGPGGSEHLTNSYSAGVLSLSWPAGEGWRLQMQTNSLSVGLSTNWQYITDGSTSSTNITVDTTKPSVFYRLKYP